MLFPFGNPAFLSRFGGGAPAVPMPAFVSDPAIASQPLVGRSVEVSEYEVSGAPSQTFQWYTGDPGDGGVAISGATGATYSPLEGDYGDTLWLRTTLTNATGTVSHDAQAPAICGAVFTEDFGDSTVGDVSADILADGWFRWSGVSDANIASASISADTTSITGKAIGVATTSTDVAAFSRTDWDTFFGANSWSSYYEELILFKHDGVGGRFFWRGKSVAAVSSVALANVAAGLITRLNVPALHLPGEDPSNTVADSTLTAITENQYYFARVRFEGDIARLRLWNANDPEPDTWGRQRTHTVALTGRGPSIGARFTGHTKTTLYVSCGGDAPAPFWPGYVPPVAEFADSLEFAAAGAGTSVTEYGGAVDITVGVV